MKIKDLLDIDSAIGIQIKEFQNSLKALRGGHDNWRDGITRDERQPVKILFARLVEIEKAYVSFRESTIQLPPDTEKLLIDSGYMAVDTRLSSFL